jgi:hypothetical protein
MTIIDDDPIDIQIDPPKAPSKGNEAPEYDNGDPGPEINGNGYDRDPRPEPPRDAGTAFPFTTFADACAAAAAKLWLFKYLLARGETSAWVGPPGSLKSAILIALAYALATGQDWCGKRNKGRCAVIYFALERPDLTKRRLRAYAERDGEIDAPIAVVSRTINFMDPKVVADVIATIDAVEKRFGIPVGLIIIDTLAKAIAAGGGDEDKARDHGAVYANLARIKEQRSVHFALACHPGKNAAKGVRGSSAALGDFDIQVDITGDDTRVATITKNNDGPEGVVGSFAACRHSFTDEKGDPMLDEDDDPIEVWLAEPIADETATMRPAKREWTSKALRLLKRSIENALVDTGHEVRPYNDGPLVRAVDKQFVRAEFIKHHTADDDTTKRRTFNRAVEDAQDKHLIGICATTDEVQLMWLA